MYYSYDSKWGICSCLILSILSLHINMTNDMSPIGEFEGNMTAASLIFTILKGQLASAKNLDKSPFRRGIPNFLESLNFGGSKSLLIRPRHLWGTFLKRGKGPHKVTNLLDAQHIKHCNCLGDLYRFEIFPKVGGFQPGFH